MKLQRISEFPPLQKPILRYRDLRLRQKLLLLYCLVIIIPTIVLGLYAYTSTKSSLENQLMQSAQNEVQHMTNEINHRLARQEVAIKSIAFHPALVKAMNDAAVDPSSMAEKMDKVVEPIFSDYLYFIRDMTNITLYSEYRTSDFGDFIRPSSAVKQMDWYQQTKTGPATRWWYADDKIFATRNIYDLDTGRISAVLYVRFDSDRLLGDLASENLNDNSLLLTNSYKNIVLAKNISVKLANAVITAQQTTKVTVGGISYLALRTPIPNTDWTLSYVVPTERITAGVWSIVSTTAILVLICMFALSIVILIFAETILKGIRTLNKRIGLVEAGDLSFTVQNHSKDEIGQLNTRFDGMLKQINQLIDEVYEAKIVQKEAELNALQAQVNPHFLYNSLSLINSKAIRLDSQEISELVNQLSRFYRTTLNKGQQIISIRDELANVSAYIHIQQSMHSGSFTVTYDIDEQALQYEMIHLILQPIVENAIVHGLERKREGGGQLRLTVSMEEGDILFLVSDNGVGMDDEQAQHLLERSGKGYGMKNVHERLQRFFGPRYGLSLTSRIGEGTTVTVRIPRYRSDLPQNAHPEGMADSIKF